MSFLSYAQNFEDIMLWRALGHVDGGLYVDIGAQHPRVDSVSRAFYERGWRGIHVEPVPAFADLLRADRPDETVLQVALAEREGTLALTVFADTGLTTAVASYARRHEAELGYAGQRIEVPVLTMASALKALAGKDVHWLKIDVEGFELQVLQGWDSQVLRPWVMVVEATVPNSPQADFDSWEPILMAAGYRFVYFDGLNRFYVAAEHAELAAAFSRPPNIFDAVELSGLASWGLCRPLIAERDAAAARARELQAQLAAARRRIVELEVAAWASAPRFAQLQADCSAAQAKAEELKHTSYYWWHTAEALTRQIDAIVRSRSWRFAHPLRLVARAARWALRRVKPRQPAQAGAEVATVAPEIAASSPRRLSPRAARIYADLKRAVEEGGP